MPKIRILIYLFSNHKRFFARFLFLIYYGIVLRDNFIRQFWSCTPVGQKIIYIWKLINCSWTKFIAIILNVCVFFMQHFRLKILTFRVTFTPLTFCVLRDLKLSHNHNFKQLNSIGGNLILKVKWKLHRNWCHFHYNSKNLNCIGALSFFYNSKNLNCIGAPSFFTIQRIWIALERCLFTTRRGVLEKSFF